MQSSHKDYVENGTNVSDTSSNSDKSLLGGRYAEKMSKSVFYYISKISYIFQETFIYLKNILVKNLIDRTSLSGNIYLQHLEKILVLRHIVFLLLILICICLNIPNGKTITNKISDTVLKDKLLTIKNKYSVEWNFIWKIILAGIKSVSEIEPPASVIFSVLILHASAHESNALIIIKNILEDIHSALNESIQIPLKHISFENIHENYFQELRVLLSDPSNMVIIEHMEKASTSMLNVWLSLGDHENAPNKNSFIFLLFFVNEISCISCFNEDLSQMNAAEREVFYKDIFTNFFCNKLPEDKISALISRIGNFVIPIKVSV